MLENLLQLDKQAFLAINNGLANPFFDAICPWIRKQELWYPLYALFIAFIIKDYKKESWKILLGVAVLVLLCDQFSANLVKNTFMRLRPCVEPSLQGITRHLVSSCAGYSFMSAHATNHFGLAIYLSFFFKQHKWVFPAMLVWASAICFSQVYVGVHYPLDVLAGAATGILFGRAISRYVLKFLTVKS